MVSGSLALLYFLLGFHGGGRAAALRSPLWAIQPGPEAQPASPMKTKEKVEQGKETTDHLMPLGYLFHQDFN